MKPEASRSAADDSSVAQQLDGPRLSDELRRAFRFDADWIDSLRQAAEEPSFGSLGAYEILGTVGRGGQGVVLRARQPRTGRILALKKLAGGAFADARARARFEREIDVVSALDHPHIVRVYGCETIDGQAVLVLEWVDGAHFDRWARPNGKPRPLREVLTALVAVCDAVQFAHERGVIHRDLKPSNILVGNKRSRDQRIETERQRAAALNPLIPRSDDPFVRVIDFGIARALDAAPSGDATLTREGQLLGTPGYSPPEVLRGRQQDVDVRADVYSLGVVLYQALTGELPHAVPSDLSQLVQSVESGEPRRVSMFNREAGRELDAIVARAIAPRSADRYRTVSAFAADLRRLLAGEAVEAHAPSALYRWRKFLRRHVIAVSIVSGFVLLLFAGATTSTLLYLQALRESDRADGEAAQARSALQAEARQTRLAKREAEKQAAVQQILSEIITAGDRGQRQGNPDVRIRDVLDDFADRLRRNAVRYDPEIEAQVCSTIGSVYHSLGLFAHAEEMHRRSVELRAAAPEQFAELARARLGLAGSLRGQQKLAECGEVLRLAMSLLEQRGLGDPGKSAEYAALLGELAGLQQALGDADAAYQTRLRILDTTHQRHDADQARVLNNLAIASKDKDESIGYLLEALDIYRALPENHERDVASTLSNLGMFYRAAGRFAEAEAAQREALSAHQKLLGPDHPDTGTVMRNLGLACASTGKVDEGAEYVWQGLEILRCKLGSQAPSIAAGYENHVAMLRYFKKHELLLRPLQALVEIAAERQPRDETLLARRNVDLAATLIDLSRFDEAAVILSLAESTLAADAAAPTELVRARQQLVRLYETWGAALGDAAHAEELAQWRERLATARAATQPAAPQ